MKKKHIQILFISLLLKVKKYRLKFFDAISHHIIKQVPQKTTTAKSRKQITKSVKKTTQEISTDTIKNKSTDAFDTEINNMIEEPSSEIINVSKIRPNMINFRDME